MADPDGLGAYEEAAEAAGGDEAVLEELFPMCSYGIRQRRLLAEDSAGVEMAGSDGEAEEEKYFGTLTGCQKTAFGASNIGWYGMKFMVVSFAKIFYTDDYPRVNLAGIALVAGLQTLLDIAFDPILALWSDGLRGKFCGCIPFCGRRKPFLIISAVLGAVSFLGLWLPPPILSSTPRPKDLPGTYRFWRITETEATTGSSGGHLNSWEVREVQFFSETNLDDASLITTGKALNKESLLAFDGNESTFALSDRGCLTSMAMRATDAACSIGQEFPYPGVQVMAVKILQFDNKTTAASRGIIERSENGTVWTEAYDISHAYELNGDWGKGTLPYNTLGGLIWYLIFIVFFKVVVVTMREIPLDALPAEITPDSNERSSLWTQWAVYQAIGILLGAVIPSFHFFGPTCDGSAYSGCSQYVVIGVFFALLHMGLMMWTVCVVQERKVELLPPPEKLNFIVMIVQTWLNRPFRILLVSDIVEGLGAEVPLAVLPYMVKWVIGADVIQEVLGISSSMFFALNAVILLTTKIPFTFVWRCFVTKYGKYRTFIALNVAAVIQALLFLPFCNRKTGVYAMPFLMITWSFGTSGFWILRSMLTDVIDYDEFISGQRREGQYTMLIGLLPKFAEVPGVTLPFFLMAKFGYDPNLEPWETPSGVVWTLVISFSVVPAVFTLLGLFIVVRYPIRTDAQITAIQDALELHRNGKPAQDPLCQDSIVPPTVFLADTQEVKFGDRIISKENSLVLQHFFPGELQAAYDAEDLGVLRTRQLLPIALGVIVLPVGIGIMAAGWGDLDSKSGASLTPIGVIFVGFAVYLLGFSFARICKAGTAISLDIPMEDVKTQLEMYAPMIAEYSPEDLEDDSEEEEDEKAS